MRILALFVLPPAIKVPGRDDRGGEEIVKETLQCHFIGDEAMGAAATLGFPCPLDRLVVATLEGMTLTPLTLNQRVADEHFTSELGSGDWALLGDRKRRICWNSTSDRPQGSRTQPSQQHRAVCDQCQPVEHHFFLNVRRAPRRIPRGFGIDMVE